MFLVRRNSEKYRGAQFLAIRLLACRLAMDDDVLAQESSWHLPPETWQLVFSFLDVAANAAISLTCVQFSKLAAEPVVWDAIGIFPLIDRICLRNEVLESSNSILRGQSPDSPFLLSRIDFPHFPLIEQYRNWFLLSSHSSIVIWILFTSPLRTHLPSIIVVTSLVED